MAPGIFWAYFIAEIGSQLKIVIPNLMGMGHAPKILGKKPWILKCPI